MGIRLPEMVVHAKQMMGRRSVSTRSRSMSSSSMRSLSTLDVPKGYFAVYVGEGQKKRFVVPISYLYNPLFQDLLRRAEEEFGFDHPMGRLTIPCKEDDFINLTSHLRKSKH